MGNRRNVFEPLLLALLVLGSCCGRAPRLRPYEARTNEQGWSAPLIVVGLADGDEKIGQPVPRPGKPGDPWQLHRVTIHVENVLKGAVPEHRITVYYFTYVNLNSGSTPLIFFRRAERRLVTLRKDGGVYRTTSDGGNCTIPILSGAHPGYRPGPSTSPIQALIDLALTKGTGPVDDHQFANGIGRAVGWPGLEGYTIEKLGELALAESAEVKYTACRELWNYSQREIGDTLRGRARDSVAAAGCVCGLGASGIVCK